MPLSQTDPGPKLSSGGRRRLQTDHPLAEGLPATERQIPKIRRGSQASDALVLPWPEVQSQAGPHPLRTSETRAWSAHNPVTPGFKSCIGRRRSGPPAAPGGTADVTSPEPPVIRPPPTRRSPDPSLRSVKHSLSPSSPAAIASAARIRPDQSFSPSPDTKG